jgi:hypothetical protein
VRDEQAIALVTPGDAQAIVHGHEGEISVQRLVGRGTTFHAGIDAQLDKPFSPADRVRALLAGRPT